MKRIILPTDFSENAYNSIRYALQLFKDTECAFYLLHTYTPAIYQAEYVLHSPGQIGLGDVYLEDSLAQLNKLLETIEKEFNNSKHVFMPHASFNLLVDEITEIIKKEKIDLVVMGTQGATGAKEIFLGSQTVHVIKKATCPVMAIPSNFEYEPPKDILFPTDFEVDYQKKQLQELVEIAKNHKATIQVLHISKGYGLEHHQLDNRRNLYSLLETTTHLFHDMPNQGVIDGINTFQTDKKMDMLVMIQNKHTFLERLFIEPVIKKIGFHVSIPFMVIPHLQKN